MLTLGIESSCDETAVALVEGSARVLASVIHSQVADHTPYGGVVPEVAAREHLGNLGPVLDRCLAEAGRTLDEIDLIAVTDRPGLVGALLIGVAGAQALGVALDRPVVGVNHVEAHLIAPFVALSRLPDYPLVSLVVSGGHTHLFHSSGPSRHRLLGATLDDAAGEAFDKVAKLLGLGYPGGPAIQKAAEDGDARAFAFKRSFLARDSLDFSFSGLKTAVLYRCFGQDSKGRPLSQLADGLRREDVAASFQAAVVDVLVEKLGRAVAVTGCPRVALGGGVACNGPLRGRIGERAAEMGWELLLPPPELCTDNAAMIAALGAQTQQEGRGKPPEVAGRARWERWSG